MNISLLPITAILLLLSGMGAPARAAGSQASVAVLGGYWLGAHHASPALGTSVSRLRLLQFSAFPPAEAAALPASPVAPASAPGQTLQNSRKLYTTRFGFAEGAYLALGPPAGSLPAVLG